MRRVWGLVYEELDHKHLTYARCRWKDEIRAYNRCPMPAKPCMLERYTMSRIILESPMDPEMSTEAGVDSVNFKFRCSHALITSCLPHGTDKLSASSFTPVTRDLLSPGLFFEGGRERLFRSSQSMS